MREVLQGGNKMLDAENQIADVTAEVSMSDPQADPQVLLAALRNLRHDVAGESGEIASHWRGQIQRDVFWTSAQNLAAYLSLRERDLRPLQTALMPWGLSSLGRSESRVLATLDAVIATLAAIVHEGKAGLPKHPPLSTFFFGEKMLAKNVEALFGRPTSRRRARIMVTLPTEATTDYAFLRDLVERGMDCARINCAHDSSTEWEGMIANIRRAEEETHRVCKILMDLGGPKARTGQVVLPEPKHRLFRGDRFLLTRDAPVVSPQSAVQVACQLPEVLDQVPVGAEVWIDEGRLGTAVDARLPQGLLLRVTRAGEKGERLRSDKGLNFPGTELNISPLTAKDLSDLDFVARHADIVGYSFVQDAADIELLQEELRQRQNETGRLLAIIAKIETPRAVRNLPQLIVQAAGKQPLGVMIARGDLAVEIGYERLAEIQEEMLWVCEAAHIPVIWATQVLENFVSTGRPSRAEMTDAAMAQRAECVMLNKGPYIGEAVTILNGVFTRMQDHQVKKTSHLRALRMWHQDSAFSQPHVENDGSAPTSS
jgi:pyruvate kinase